MVLLSGSLLTGGFKVDKGNEIISIFHLSKIHPHLNVLIVWLQLQNQPFIKKTSLDLTALSAQSNSELDNQTSQKALPACSRCVCDRKFNGHCTIIGGPDLGKFEDNHADATMNPIMLM